MFLCRLSLLCCGYCAVFPTLDFILLICYLFIFFEIPILILMFVWNYCNVHSEPTQTFKMEFFGGNSLVNCSEPLTNLQKAPSQMFGCIGTIYERKRSWEMPHRQFYILPLCQEKGLLIYQLHFLLLFWHKQHDLL